MLKRGVSLYSFQEETFLGKMTLEDCVAFAASIGAKGIEILPEQNLPGYPNITDAQIEEWHGLMDKYGTIPTCADIFLDTKMRKERLMTDDEQVKSIVRDLKIAKRLGAKVVRSLIFVRPDILEKCIPYAEDLDVKIGVEVHAPWYPDNAWIQRTLEIAERKGTKHLGLVMDMGIFTNRYPPVMKNRFLRDGATPHIADFICQQYEDRVWAEYIILEVTGKMKGNVTDVKMAESLRLLTYSNPKRVKDIAPYIFHIHAKFLEMTEDCQDPSIDYETVIPLLLEANYQGYISSEYEGNRWIQDLEPVDSRELVRRQHVMLERIEKSFR